MSNDLRAILVCVDYSDLLAITLPYNRHHFKEVWVVTAPYDNATMEVSEANKAHILTTDAFYDDGARFNKWKALELGLDAMGREGWLCLLDADVLWPKDLRRWESGYLVPTHVGYFCTPYRRMMEYPSPIAISHALSSEQLWSHYPLHRNSTIEYSGYSQIFHASDPVLGHPPWHDIGYIHAGASDSWFQQKWPRERKVRPGWEVLHLGEPGVNWMGRATQRLDGSVPGGAADRRRAMDKLWQSRRERRSRGQDPFQGERITGTES